MIAMHNSLMEKANEADLVYEGPGVTGVLLDEKAVYDGSQLNSLFAYDKLKLQRDSIVAFMGPANVLEHLVDREDSNNKDFIKAANMVHFLVNFTGNDLEKSTIYQRLFIAVIIEVLENLKNNTNEPELLDNKFIRDGDDIFYQGKKMSVSIATISTNQKMLIHTGINIDATGAPVPAIGLKEIGIDPREFTVEVLRNFGREVDSIRNATYKVKAVD